MLQTPIVHRCWHVCLLLLSVLLAVACQTPQAAYFTQTDSVQLLTAAQQEQMIKNLSAPLPPIQPGERLSIIVHSAATAEASFTYNKNLAAFRSTNLENYFPTRTADQSSYTVSPVGTVEMPVIGLVEVGGKTLREAEAIIQQRLRTSGYLRDALVFVSFLDRTVSVLGEVEKPQRVPFVNDQLTLLDALTAAGDLKIRADRNKIFVVRREDSLVKSYRMDLSKTTALFASPAYQLRPGDVIYVQPNTTRMLQSVGHGNEYRHPSFYVSLVSGLVSIATAILLFI